MVWSLFVRWTAIANCRLDLKNSYLTRFFAFNHDEFVIILRYANTFYRATILVSAIADLVGWVSLPQPNIAFISYLNFLGFTSFKPTYSAIICFIIFANPGSSGLGMVRCGGINRLNPYLARDLID